MPLYYETEQFRAVHACWDDKIINFLKNKLIDNRLTDELIYESVQKETQLHNAIEETLKGKEIKMPAGLDFKDKDGTVRTEIRIKWWENPAEMTYREFSVEPLENLPKTKIDLSLLKNTDFYKQDQKPVFFGHYWLKGKPLLNKDNVCCLDYSVAKEGKLVAYTFDGGSKLADENLKYV